MPNSSRLPKRDTVFLSDPSLISRLRARPKYSSAAQKFDFGVRLPHHQPPNMASPPPPPPTSLSLPTTELRKDAMTAPASPASTASLPSEQASDREAGSPEQPRKRPKSSRRRLRRVAKAKAKNNGERSARALTIEFNYQQRQNRSWLHHQVQLPGRGGVGREVEGELRALFGKGESCFCSLF